MLGPFCFPIVFSQQMERFQIFMFHKKKNKTKSNYRPPPQEEHKMGQEDEGTESHIY